MNECLNKSLIPSVSVKSIYFFDFQGTYKSSCFSNNMMRCEVGDLSGKHARLNVGFGKQFFTDCDLPLFGDMSGEIILTRKKNENKK